MEKIKKIHGAHVVVEVISKNFGHSPNAREYNSPLVKKFHLCEKIDGKFFDLRTEEERTGDQVWDVFPGVSFLYPDGTHLLVTRFFDQERSLGLMRLAPGDYRPTMVLIQSKLE